MNTRTFKGGIHPPERKERTHALPIEAAFPSSKTVVIPITQGGAPNNPLVKAGDSVARGQKIAECDAFMSAPVHASIAGTVKKIEPRAVTGNIDAPCIIIEADDSGKEEFLPILDPFSCTKESALERIKSAGIVGMGGASFPTHVKLKPPADKKIDFVLANGAECEPYLTIDDRTMQEHADSVIDGLLISMKIVDAPKGCIVLEDNKVHLVAILNKAIEKTQKNDSVSVVLCKTQYPQGGEKMIIKAAVNREVPSGKLPADAGCVVQNVGTLKAISEAFRKGQPLIERSLTISGGACETPKNITVPIGTLVGDLIPSVVQLHAGVKKIISGGPMMGFSMANAAFPVQKNTSGVLFLTEQETSLLEEDVCIGCGKCMTVCSCRLSPVLMVRALKANNLDQAVKCGLMDCVECGSCAYICPGKIKLVQRFRMGKQLYRQMQQLQQKTGGGK